MRAVWFVFHPFAEEGNHIGLQSIADSGLQKKYCGISSYMIYKA
jgi:hypothetical protein